MEYEAYEKGLDQGMAFECSGCNQEITKEDDWTWESGNVYCSECLSISDTTESPSESGSRQGSGGSYE